jgi:ribose 5-phosphate isomerase B
MSIAANKVSGIRCALVQDSFTAKRAREHNDTNVLALGQQVVGLGVAEEIVATWLATPFSGGERHCRRLEKATHVAQDAPLSGGSA